MPILVVGRSRHRPETIFGRPYCLMVAHIVQKLSVIRRLS